MFTGLKEDYISPSCHSAGIRLVPHSAIFRVLSKPAYYK
jgi:hypothetical protein